MFPNQFVNIKLLVDTVKDAIVVPVAAVQRGQPGIYVYKVKADDSVTVQVIETGATDGEKIAVTKGLAVGDQVVIDGVDRLRDGAKIRKPAPPGGANPKPVGDGTGASAAPSTSDAPSSKTAPQTGEAPAPGQQRRGNGERRANGASDRPAQTNQ
jgi:multidrug efflux system membrane fusion protein